MKTKITNRKSNLLKLTKVLMIGALMSLGLKANAQCTAGFTYSVDPAENGNVTFTNTSSTSLTGIHYYWYFDDGTISTTTSATFTHYFAFTGTYNVSLQMLDSLGSLCNDTAFQIINVIDTMPVISSCNASFYTTQDTTGLISFYDNSTGTGITNYFWDFGDGTTSTFSNPGAHNFIVPGNHIICLTVSNSSGSCSSTYCNSVYSSSCHANVSSTMDALGLTASFTSTVTGSADTYYWDFGDGTTSTLPNPTHTYTPGYYVYRLTVTSSTDSACYDTASSHITPMAITCHAHFTIVQDSSDLYNFMIYNSSSSPSTLVSYLWDFGDGTTSTLLYPTHTYASTTPVLLCLTISDGFGCTDTYCDSILPGVPRSGTFTISVLPTGINEQSQIIASLENYPNPFSESTTISYAIKQNAAVELSIVDLLGNKIAEIENGNKPAGAYTTTWNSEGIAKGMYLLQLKVNNAVSTKKLIITK